MEFGELPDDATKGITDDHQKRRRYNVVVALNGEQMAAAEGWRAAHGIADQAEALGELIKLGLLSEIAKIYRLVTEGRMQPTDVRTEADGPVQYKY